MSGDGETPAGTEGAVFDAFQRLLEELERYLPLPSGSGPPVSPSLQSASISASPLEHQRTPSIEVMETSTHVHVTIEVPWSPRETVNLQASPEALTVRLSGGSPGFETVIPLPTAVRVQSMQATDRNGVLDVTLERAAKERGRE